MYFPIFEDALIKFQSLPLKTQIIIPLSIIFVILGVVDRVKMDKYLIEKIYQGEDKYHRLTQLGVPTPIYLTLLIGLSISAFSNFNFDVFAIQICYVIMMSIIQHWLLWIIEKENKQK